MTHSSVRGCADSAQLGDRGAGEEESGKDSQGVSGPSQLRYVRATMVHP